jgi:glutamate carboxypeptidase
MCCIVVCALALTLFLFTSLAAADPNAVLLQKSKDSKEALLKDLETYVNIDTGTGCEEGLKKFQSILIERLKAMGADVKAIEIEKPMAGYNIVATFTGTGKGSILLLAHADTVWNAGEAAKRPFRIEGDKAFGPGVSDEKGGVVLALYALQLINDMGYQDFAKITFLINPDEEKGSFKSRDLIMHLAKEHTYTLCMESGLLGDKVTTWRKGIGYLKMEVIGRNSHAGTAPERGRNATLELAHQIIQLSKLGNRAKRTSVNWTVLEKTNTPSNVIPDHAAAQADVRVLFPEEFDRVMNEAKKLSAKHLVSDTTVTLELITGRPPFAENARTDKLASSLQKIYGLELGLPLAVEGSGGGSDANYAAMAGSIAIDGLGIVGGNDHSPDEFIELKSIVPRLYLLTKIIMDIGASR